MLVKTYNQEGKEVKSTKLPEEIFGIPFNPDLVWQVVVSQAANRRQILAHTKNRSEVRGGGRKPWPQKGTGRARHGSIRSPLWRGGGVTFGPRKERIFTKKIPKKMRRKALFMVLSQKALDKEVVVLDELKLKNHKTKELIKILAKVLPEKNALIALPEYDKNLVLASRNIPKIQSIRAADLNALDLLSFKYLILTKLSLKKIKAIFLKR